MASRKENVANGKGSAKAAAASLHEETLMKQPKPARSAFMCFSDAKEKEFTSDGSIKKKELIRRVADAWKELTPKERAFWDEEARNDKLRFVQQKAAYKGPWEVPKRRAKKHPLAPKRPMSAFLKYSQMKRKFVKEQNPDMANTDVSRLLGEMWRNASPKEKAPFVEQEERERAIYKKDIARFKAEQAKKDAESRTSHESVQRMREYPTQAQEETHEAPSAEEANDAGSNQHARFYEAYHPEQQIAPVASSDSHSLHENRGPHFDPYAGSQYSSRRHPPVGTVTFSLSSDGEHPPLNRGRSYDSTLSAGNTQQDYDEQAFRSRYFTDSSRYYARYP